MSATIINQNSGSTTTTSGTTINIYTFVDNNGNVTQIEKKSKSRLKYYVDPNASNSHCVIGVEDEESGPCSEGTALGLGENLVADIYYIATNNNRKIL